MAVTNRVQNQGVWISSGLGATADASPLLSGQVGMVLIKNSRAYQLVQIKATSAAVAQGQAFLWADKVNFIVSATVGDAADGINGAAGVIANASTSLPALGQYCWIQVGGVCDSTSPAGTNQSIAATGVIAAGASLIWGTGGVCTAVAAGTASTNVPIATATGAQSGGFITGEIIVPHNGW